ncbi:hypothetical protein ONE63_004339 [Megalurothrips usitatus]|uniref:Amine oxidase domain-containing protein n=1 Tax=Megalurothrips usitatus TaxID=439358 RepID=A0AAV7X2I4_9NEOP|nr:hypothetical protein ONE63_004339 [Megalurothrips usitatus]
MHLKKNGVFSRSASAQRRNHSRVLIIGAGASGYAAASRLMENGFYDLTVLEAEPRIGGRVNTVRFAENIVELGAEWVHGEVGNVVYEMAEPLELLGHNAAKRDFNSHMDFVWSGGALAERAEIELLLNTSQAIRDAVDVDPALASYTGSYGEFFLDKFNQKLMALERRPPAELVDRFLGWFEKATGFYDGSDTWFNTSGRGLLHYRECEGDLAITWKRGGYRTVFDLLTKRFPNPSQELPVRRRVLLNSEVAVIRWAEREATSRPKPPIVVELSNGARYTADLVLVTVSLGVLKHSADTLFDPPLPQRKMNAVRNLGFGQVNKLFMYFSDPWWPSGLSGYSVLVTEDDLEAFKRKYPQYGSMGHWVHGLSGFYIDQHKPSVVLFDWIVGEPARVMERYSDYQIMMGCKDWLDMFLGQNFTIPTPIGFTRSMWWTNKHFKGSYSYRSLDSDRADAWAAHLAEPILDRDGEPAVLFAGEATHDYYYSTVHGAIESGWREADRILGSLK